MINHTLTNFLHQILCRNLISFKKSTGMKLLKSNDKVNFYNITDGFLSTLILNTYAKL